MKIPERAPVTSLRDDVTQILADLNAGDDSALERLMPMVYGELRKMAGGVIGPGRTHQTLQPTALVHEAFLKLLGGRRQSWKNRAHFYSVAATAMRTILIDEARRKASLKRGGDRVHVSFADADGAVSATSHELLALDQALDRLEQRDPAMAKVVHLRYFAGLTVEETARALDVSRRSVDRLWRRARAWLARETR